MSTYTGTGSFGGGFNGTTNGSGPFFYNQPPPQHVDQHPCIICNKQGIRIQRPHNLHPMEAILRMSSPRGWTLVIGPEKPATDDAPAKPRKFFGFICPGCREGT